MRVAVVIYLCDFVCHSPGSSPSNYKHNTLSKSGEVRVAIPQYFCQGLVPRFGFWAWEGTEEQEGVFGSSSVLVRFLVIQARLPCFPNCLPHYRPPLELDSSVMEELIIDNKKSSHSENSRDGAGVLCLLYPTFTTAGRLQDLSINVDCFL